MNARLHETALVLRYYRPFADRSIELPVRAAALEVELGQVDLSLNTGHVRWALAPGCRQLLHGRTEIGCEHVRWNGR
jgi:hypothetical protein